MYYCTYWEPVNLFISAHVPVPLLLGMSASEDMQLCSTLRSAPSYRKLPLPVLHTLPRGRLWPRGRPLLGKAGRVSLTLPVWENSGVYHSCRVLWRISCNHTAGQLPLPTCLFHFLIFPRSTAQGQFPFSTYLVITESFLENPI